VNSVAAEWDFAAHFSEYRPDFVIDMSALLHGQQAAVYVASSFSEYDRLQMEGVAVRC